jgi:hypothetical protein
MAEQLNKVCTKCRRVLPLSAFTKSSKGDKLGLNCRCRECVHDIYVANRIRDGLPTCIPKPVATDDTTRECTKCGRTLLLSEFYKANTSRGKFGHSSRCKRCKNELHAKYVAQRWPKPEPTPTGFKRCSKCSVIKPVSEFTQLKKSRDGFCGRCKECKRAKQRQEYLDHPGRQWAASQRWIKTHKERHDAANRLHQAIRRAASRETDLTPDDVLRILKGPCAFCGTKEKLTLAHNVPVSRGGLTTIENTFCLCQPCNSQMGTMTLEEYRRRR